MTKNPYTSYATRTSSAEINKPNEVVIAKLKQELQTMNKLGI